MERLYVTLPVFPEHKAWLREAAGDACEVIFRDECNAEQAAFARANATAVFGEPKLSALAEMPNLRWIQMSWAGTERYTAAPEFPQNIQLTCASGCYGETIAEYLFAVILALYRMIPGYVRNMQSGSWKPDVSEGIEGKTVLILGAGNIGTEFAKRLRPFGAHIIGVRRTAREMPAEFDEMYTMEALPALWARADIVASALPNTVQTRNLLDEQTLLKLKPDALLVNVGRGTLLDVDILARVMQTGHLRGAALDVCEPEPLPETHPLWQMENVIITPHVAGLGFGGTPETTNKIVRLCCRNLKRYLRGDELESRVNFETGYAHSK